MVEAIQRLLAKLDYRVTGRAYSRPQTQVRMILQKFISRYRSKRVGSILDIGGGINPQYKTELLGVCNKYTNLEIRKGPGVDVVGSVYELPFANGQFSAVALFMVLEHLEEPTEALRECHRVLKRKGYLLITTVQYWHTHGHPDDYYRYTKSGLKYVCKKTGFKVLCLWSHGGPILVIFHSIELNMPPLCRLIFSTLFYKVADYLDLVFFKHQDTRRYSDSVGWSLIAKKL